MADEKTLYESGVKIVTSIKATLTQIQKRKDFKIRLENDESFRNKISVINFSIKKMEKQLETLRGGSDPESNVAR